MRPLPVARKRFAAPRLVFSLGILCSCCFTFVQRFLNHLNHLGAAFQLVFPADLRLPVLPSSASGSLSWRQHHDHLPAFHARTLFNDNFLIHVVFDPLEQIAAQILMGHFTSARSDEHTSELPS